MNKLVIGVAALVIVIISMSAYTVDEREKVLLLSLGEIKNDNLTPGLHFKFPLVNNVLRFDSRILTLDANPERFLTIEKKNVTVDFFVKWRIENIGQYYRSTRGDERNAVNRLSQIIKDGLRNEFAKRTIQQAVSGERQEIMKSINETSKQLALQLGIDVVDVRISRIDLPDEVSGSVYDRMRAERARIAKELRAQGQEAAERLRATADRQRAVILANAYKQSQEIRGSGDAEAAETYARAYQRNEDFYSFYRSMESYRRAFRGKDDMLVLQPDSEFFHFFGGPAGTGEEKPKRVYPVSKPAPPEPEPEEKQEDPAADLGGVISVPPPMEIPVTPVVPVTPPVGDGAATQVPNQQAPAQQMLPAIDVPPVQLPPIDAAPIAPTDPPPLSDVAPVMPPNNANINAPGNVQGVQ